MLKCDSSKCRGTLFMTVKGNNSSLPANCTFLRGWRSQCQSWIQHLVSHNTPYHHTHDLAPPSIYNSCYKIVIRTFHRVFRLKQARGKSLLWNEVCLWNILHLYTLLFCHEQRCLFMNKAFFQDAYQWNFPLVHKTIYVQSLCESNWGLFTCLTGNKIVQNAGNVMMGAGCRLDFPSGTDGCDLSI